MMKTFPTGHGAKPAPVAQGTPGERGGDGLYRARIVGRHGSGAGPIGLPAALLEAQRGLDVDVLDRVIDSSPGQWR